METKLICKWNACKATFNSRSELYQHLIAHIDAIALAADLKKPTSTSKNSKSAKNGKNKESSQSSTSVNNEDPTKGTDLEPSRKAKPTSSPSKKKKSNTIPDDDPPVDDIICKYCRSPKFKMQNQIVECDKCGNWYHQLCHIPMINDRFIKNVNAVWICKDCTVAAAADAVNEEANSLPVEKPSE